MLRSDIRARNDIDDKTLLKTISDMLEEAGEDGMVNRIELTKRLGWETNKVLNSIRRVQKKGLIVSKCKKVREPFEIVDGKKKRVMQTSFGWELTSSGKNFLSGEA